MIPAPSFAPSAFAPRNIAGCGRRSAPSSISIARGLPQRVDHPGYWHDDAFYEGRGRADAVNSCNHWVADRLRVAGVETSLWSPFAQGLMWRYREVDQST